MMKSNARANPSPWRSASASVGSGCCAVVSQVPARNAEPKVSRKSSTLSKGGRSAPSVPGSGGRGGTNVSSARGTGSTREPFPRFAQQIQPESRLPLQAAGKCTVLAGFLAAAESGERLGQVVVDVRGRDSAAHRLLPARNRAFQLLAPGQRRAEPLQRVRIVAPLLERLLEPGDGLAVAVLAEERGSHPLECRGPLRLQREGVRDPLLGSPGLALREVDLRERQPGLEGGGIDRQQLLAGLARVRH